MNIQSLYLRGFTGLKKGMGIDEISLDFSNMEGLVAIAGDTGIGKSTIMENLHPYPRLVSRPNPALRNHVFLRDSLKELSFIHNGDHFNTVTKIDSQSGRSEGFIYMNQSEKSLNDGKITSYRDAITEMFGSTDLFFNSVFCAQNSEKMSAMDPADLKRLFVEFLGTRLEILVDQEETSKQCSNIILKGIETLDRDIEREQKVCDGFLHATDEKLNALIALKDSRNHDINRLREAVEMSKTNITALEVKIGQQEMDLKAIEDIESAKAETNKLKVDAQIEYENDAAKIRTLIKQAEDDLSEVNATLGHKETIENAVLEIEKNRDVINALEIEINALTDTLKTVTDTLEGERKELMDLKAEFDGNTKAHHEAISKSDKLINALNVEIAHKKAEIKRLYNDPELAILKRSLEVANESVADLDKRGTVTCPSADVPLHPYEFDCNTENCTFVKKALDAKENIPKIEKEIEERQLATNKRCKQFEEGLAIDIKDLEVEQAAWVDERSKYGSVVEEYGKLELEITTRGRATAKRQGSVSAEIEAARMKLKACRENDETYSKLASMAPDIKVAEARKVDIEKAFMEAKGREHDLEEKFIKLSASFNGKVSQYNNDIDRLKKGIDVTIDSRIETIKESIGIAERDLESTLKELEKLDGDIAKIRTFKEEREKAEKKIEAIKEKRADLVSEQANWAYLQTKCGANGLRALEINSVAPSIVHDGNSLLEAALGSWAMIDIQTLDEEGREVLRPVCIDQDGETVLVANRSGGQQVWAMKAMRLAMTMVSKTKSGRDFKTAYADEDDAGLDIETAKNFTKLYRAFMNQGAFEKVFFVSHKPQCVDLADHVLRIGKGGIIV